MKLEELWQELKERRVVRVAISYAVVAAVVVQTADLTLEPLGLPAWTYRFVLLLMIGGFPVAVVLAWAFDVTSTGVQRTAPAVTSSGRPSRLPFVAGLAVGILSVVAVAYAFSGRSPDGVRLTEASDLDPDVVAIVPFRFSGPEDQDYFGEGVVDLLTARFTGEVGPRAVDPAAAGAVWRELPEVEPSAAGETIARALGAGLLISGAIVADPSGLNIRAAMRDLVEGREIGSAEVQAPADSLASAVDRVAAALLSRSVGEYRESLDQLTSTSPEALREYLLGQRDWRGGQWSDAARRFLRAVELDSTFALAAIGAADAANMPTATGASGMLALAWRHRERLGERDRAYLRARVGPRYPDTSTRAERIRALGDAAALFPDRAQIWYFLGEEFFHYRRGLSEDWSEVSESYFQEALRLDPRHTPAAHHLWQVYLDRGDMQGVRRALELLASLDPSNPGPSLQLVITSPDTTGFGEALSASLEHGNVGQAMEMAWLLHHPALITDSYLIPAAEASLEEMLSRPTTGLENLRSRLVAYRAYQLIGRPQTAHEVLSRWEAENDTVLHRTRILDAAFDALPDQLGAPSAEHIAANLREAGPGEHTSDDLRDLIALQLYRLTRGEVAGLDDAARVLRLAQPDFSDARQMAWEAAALLFDAAVLEAAGEGSAARDALELMDDLNVQGPAYGSSSLNNAILFPMAELHERLGDPRRALGVLDREVINTNQGDVYQARFARERGRLASLIGEMERAGREYRYYLIVRSRPEPEVEAEVEAVRRAYEALTP